MPLLAVLAPGLAGSWDATDTSVSGVSGPVQCQLCSHSSGIWDSCAGMKPAGILQRLQKESKKGLSAAQPLLMLRSRALPPTAPSFLPCGNGKSGRCFTFQNARKAALCPLKHTQGGPHIFCTAAGCAGLLQPGWQRHARVLGVLLCAPLPWLMSGERFPPSSDLGASRQKHLLERGQT